MIRTLIRERYSLGGIFVGILSCVYSFVSPSVRLTVVPSVLGSVADNQTKGLTTCGLNDEASISIERRDDEQCSALSKNVFAEVFFSMLTFSAQQDLCMSASVCPLSCEQQVCF